jgi:hypothetical protein
MKFSSPLDIKVFYYNLSALLSGWSAVKSHNNFLALVSVTHNLLTYLLHGATYFFQKVDSHSACQTTACFLYGTRRFITVVTKAHHWTLSRASRIQLAPSIPISLRPTLMLSYHLRLSSQWSLTFGPPNQNPVSTSSPPP